MSSGPDSQRRLAVSESDSPPPGQQVRTLWASFDSTEECIAALDALAAERQQKREAQEEEREARRGAEQEREAQEQEKERIEDLEGQAVFLQERLDHIDELWKDKSEELRHLRNLLGAARQRSEDLCEPPFRWVPPGPEALKCINSQPFETVCGLIVAGNLALVVLVIRGDLPDDHGPVDDAFLAWYVCELLLKLVYFGHHELLGSISEVWMNWLDFMIVLGGVGCEWGYWGYPAATARSGKQGPPGPSKLLGALRLFRVLRVIKLLRLILRRDLDWTEHDWFQVLMTIVIGANSIIMAIELSYAHWQFWPLIENALLLVYVFELTAKIKHKGISFFYWSADVGWHYIDFVIVAGSIFDVCPPLFQHLSPLLGGEESEATAEKSEDTTSTSFSLSRLLRLMRLLRILRLMKLLKKIPPLYRVLVGIIGGLQAMQWVLVLTAMVLYSLAIFFTTVIGQGDVVEDGTGETAENFSKVARSVFSLFLMMNGDFDRASGMFEYSWGQLIFFICVVISNWAILAILTAVVSDNMMSTSEAHNKLDNRRQEEEEDRHQDRRLRDIFGIAAEEEDGDISSLEWRAVMDDVQLADELSQVANKNKAVLEDLFKQLSYPSCPWTRKSVNQGAASDFRKTNQEEDSAPRQARTAISSKIRPAGSHPVPLPGEFRVIDHSTLLTYFQAREAPLDQQSMNNLVSRVGAIDKKIDQLRSA